MIYILLPHYLSKIIASILVRADLIYQDYLPRKSTLAEIPYAD